MVEVTVRACISKIFSIKYCSCAFNTPDSAPASTKATISSEVMLSSRTVETRKKRNIPLAKESKIITKGLKIKMQNRITPTVFMAICSG